MQQQNKQKEIKKQYLFKNWAPLTDCVSKITHTDTDNAKDLDDVMLIYNWPEYRDNYS